MLLQPSHASRQHLPQADGYHHQQCITFGKLRISLQLEADFRLVAGSKALQIGARIVAVTARHRSRGRVTAIRLQMLQRFDRIRRCGFIRIRIDDADSLGHHPIHRRIEHGVSEILGLQWMP